MKTLILSILIFSTFQIYCQDVFVDYLDRTEIEKKIDYQIILDRFKLDTIGKRDMATTFYLSDKFINKDNNVNTVILTESNIVGVIAYLFSFTNNGIIIDNKKIAEGFDNDDLSGPDYDSFYELEDSMVIINHQVTIPIQPTKDEPYKMHKIENFRTYIQIKKHGYFFELTEKNLPTNKRLFEFASKNLMPFKYLERLADDDLMIMRNEIYASYGYTFKSDKLIAYFGELKWYSAKYSNVDNKLSSVEKDNIQRIKQIESN